MKSSLTNRKSWIYPTKTNAEIISINTIVDKKKTAIEQLIKAGRKTKLPLFDTRPIFKSKKHDCL